MKKTIYNLKKMISVMFLMAIYTSVNAQIFYDEGKHLSASAGYKHYLINCGDFDVATIEVSYYSNPTLGWEYCFEAEYGENYLSFSPMSLVGLPFWIFAATHGYDTNVKFVTALLSISTAKLPIYCLDWLEVTPYWSLLKLTKIYDFDNEKFKINGDVGLQLKLYPFCWTNSMTTFYVSAFGEYDFGYKKNANDYQYESWAENIKKLANRSLFRGFAYGATLGIYF